MNNRIRRIFLIAINHEIFWLLLFCVTIRNIIYNSQPALLHNADSVTYYYAAQNIFNGIIDGMRTPVYPIIIKLFEWLEPSQPFQALIFFQHVISFLSIVPFYLVCKQWIRNRLLRNLSVVVWGCFPLVLLYNNALYPESILLSSLVLFVYLFSRYQVKPSATKAIVLNLYLFYLVMLKPVCLVFYGVMGAIWAFKYILEKDTKRLKPIVISFIFSVSLLLGYCTLNSIQNNYWGITTVTHDNSFINVILSGAYKTLPDKNFVTSIDSTISKGHYYTTYYLNNDHDKYQRMFAVYPLEYMNSDNMRGVKEVPPNNLGYTASQIAPYLRKAMMTDPYLGYLIEKTVAFAGMNVLYLNGLIIYLLISTELLMLLYNLFRRRQLNEIKVFVFLMAGGILLSFFMGGVNDSTYSRVLMPLAPFLVLMIFTSVDTVINFLFQSKIKG